MAHERDRAAFIKLFESYAPRLKSWLISRGVGSDEAEDIVQETMLSVWEKAALYRPDRASVSTWVFAIARNRLTDRVRKQRAFEPETWRWLLQEPPTPETEVGQAEFRELLEELLHAIPGEQSEVVRRSYLGGTSLAELSRERRVALGTIKKRARLALQKLRRALRGRI
ncbi:MAG: sigma-70 family RNA polymerase sigma factor [Myxococcota bacterium]